MKSNKKTSPSLEVAVYRVSHPASFDALQLETMAQLDAFAGFGQALALRGVEDASLRADVVLWTSLTHAHAAAEALQADPRFERFRAALGEIQHFAHYAGPTVERLQALSRGPVVELAAYQGKSGMPMDRLQAAIHAALPHVDGVVAHYPTRREDGEVGHLDVIAWRDATAMKAAPPQVLDKDPTVAPFFDAMEVTHVFELFEVVGA